MNALSETLHYEILDYILLIVNKTLHRLPTMSVHPFFLQKPRLVAEQVHCEVRPLLIPWAHFKT